jgi:hypothetical protein
MPPEWMSRDAAERRNLTPNYIGWLPDAGKPILRPDLALLHSSAAVVPPAVWQTRDWVSIKKNIKLHTGERPVTHISAPRVSTPHRSPSCISKTLSHNVFPPIRS